MAVPTSFPVWLSAAGQPDMLVNDMMSYNNAVAIGYSYNPAATPMQTVPTGTTQASETITETSVNPAQPDPAQPIQQP